MILVISHDDDDHARGVIAVLRDLGADARLFDVASFPQQASLALRYGDLEGCDLTLEDAQGRLDLRAVDTVWWRRPQPLELDPRVPPAEVQFTYTECAEAITGLWTTLEAFWVNDPGRDRAAAHKAHQLRVADDAGLRIPRTLITNDPHRARAFVDELAPAPTVYKCFSATPEHWRETRVLRADELALLVRVAIAPVIFQEYVPAEVDVRVTIVGDACFPAAITAAADAYPVDFRIDLDRTHIEPTELPGDVEARLRDLLARLGLVYGAIDLRRTPDGEHVFLEVNPAGQWRFVERQTGQPITEAVARTLAAGRPAAPRPATVLGSS